MHSLAGSESFCIIRHHSPKPQRRRFSKFNRTQFATCAAFNYHIGHGFKIPLCAAAAVFTAIVADLWHSWRAYVHNANMFNTHNARTIRSTFVAAVQIHLSRPSPVANACTSSYKHFNCVRSFQNGVTTAVPNAAVAVDFGKTPLLQAGRLLVCRILSQRHGWLHGLRWNFPSPQPFAPSVGHSPSIRRRRNTESFNPCCFIEFSQVFHTWVKAALNHFSVEYIESTYIYLNMYMQRVQNA